MKNDINDIKNMLEQEQEKARSEKELEQELFKNMFLFANCYNNYIIGAIKYIGLSQNRSSFINMVARNNKEYTYLLMNYDKVYNKIKNTFKEDMHRAERQLQQTQKTNIKRKKTHLTIFGVHWALVVFLFPVALLMILFDDLK